ncbi:hypothetical protein [Brevundimonas sp.]|uniref:hypothetical protein n=1 Tax=Brevundimonas sp. TaxID=1871086 RepID=UPI0025B8025C|nr:hypothetical protein [Brevundimonas sp.]
MDPIFAIIPNIKAAAEAHGLAALAREAGVPYTTVKSFSDRNWTHKNLEIITALNGAAVRLAGAGQ